MFLEYSVLSQNFGGLHMMTIKRPNISLRVRSEVMLGAEGQVWCISPLSNRNEFSRFYGAGLVGEPVQMVTTYDAVWHGTQLCVFSMHSWRATFTQVFVWTLGQPYEDNMTNAICYSQMLCQLYMADACGYLFVNCIGYSTTCAVDIPLARHIPIPLADDVINVDIFYSAQTDIHPAICMPDLCAARCRYVHKRLSHHAVSRAMMWAGRTYVTFVS